MPEPRTKSLDSVIRELRKRIYQIQQRGDKIGEQDTIRVLITPLLAALEWDVEDLDEVRNEYRHCSQDNPVDYALFMLRTPCLFVEAKSLNIGLDDRKWVTQTLGYAATVGVEWCVLTNGDEYRLYNSHALVDADEKLFRTVKISDEGAHNFAYDTLRLLSKSKLAEKGLNVLWNAHFVDRRVKTALDDLIKKQDDALIRLIRKSTDQSLTAGDVKASLKRADVSIKFPQPVSETKEYSSPATNVIKHGEEAAKKPHKSPQMMNVAPIDLIKAGLINPPFALETTVKGEYLTASILADGSVLFQGEKFDSLSTAGGTARIKVNGAPPDGRKYWQTNGWKFWKYRDSKSGKLVEIDALRAEYLTSEK